MVLGRANPPPVAAGWRIGPNDIRANGDTNRAKFRPPAECQAKRLGEAGWAGGLALLLISAVSVVSGQSCPGYPTSANLSLLNERGPRTFSGTAQAPQGRKFVVASVTQGVGGWLDGPGGIGCSTSAPGTACTPVTVTASISGPGVTLYEVPSLSGPCTTMPPGEGWSAQGTPTPQCLGMGHLGQLRPAVHEGGRPARRAHQ